MTVERAHAYPLPIGAQVTVQGRVKECAGLIQPGRRLLDVGCSSGWLSEVVLRQGYRSYIGLDRVIVGRGPARARVAFVSGSVLRLPFGDNSFDAVCLFDVMEHLPKRTELEALRELHRVLETGGKLFFSTPHASPIHGPLDPAWPLGHRHYRRATVRRLLLSAGFTVDRLFVAGGVVEALDHVQLLVYKHVFRHARTTSQLVRRLIERSHSRDQRLGMTIFVVASR